MKQLLQLIVMLTLLTALGVVWFWGVEGWHFVDALYMTVITLSTVGYSEVHPLDESGRWFVIVYLSAGLGVFMYGVLQVGEVLLQAELNQWWRRRNMDQTIKTLQDHYIVCGCGRMGQMVCQQLADERIAFVAVDRNDEAVEYCQHHKWPVVVGDATEDRDLLEAGIERARGVAAVLTTDADNLFVVISAKLLNPRVRVIARAFDEKTVAKMRRAGADDVVSLYASGASRMSHLLTQQDEGNV